MFFPIIGKLLFGEPPGKIELKDPILDRDLLGEGFQDGGGGGTLEGRCRWEVWHLLLQTPEEAGVGPGPNVGVVGRGGEAKGLEDIVLSMVSLEEGVELAVLLHRSAGLKKGNRVASARVDAHEAIAEGRMEGGRSRAGVVVWEGGRQWVPPQAPLLLGGGRRGSRRRGVAGAARRVEGWSRGRGRVRGRGRGRFGGGENDPIDRVPPRAGLLERDLRLGIVIIVIIVIVITIIIILGGSFPSTWDGPNEDDLHPVGHHLGDSMAVLPRGPQGEPVCINLY